MARCMVWTDDPNYVWPVWIAPIGKVLGVCIDFGVEANCGYARLTDTGEWLVTDAADYHRTLAAFEAAA